MYRSLLLLSSFFSNHLEGDEDKFPGGCVLLPGQMRFPPVYSSLLTNYQNLVDISMDCSGLRLLLSRLLPLVERSPITHRFSKDNALLPPFPLIARVPP